MSVGASRLLLDMHAVAVNEAVKPVKKDFGIFFTPEWVIDLMVGMIDKRIEEEGQAILEPACGVAQFLTGVKRNRPAFFHRTRRLGIEVNDNIIGYIRQEQIVKDVEIIQCDYLLWETDVRFDLIIGNPPYGIPSLSDHYTIRVDNETKRKYKESFSTWYGKYNVYGAFIEKSIRLLKEGGQLLFVVPATFILLDEFKKLREFLARHGETRLVYLGPDVFKPEADVATLVLDFKKSREAAHVIALLEYADGRVTPISKRDRWKGEIVIFGTPFTKRLEALCSYRLSDVYEIRVSPRTPEIKHNPWIKKEKQIDDDRYLPILNGRNLKNHRVIYEPATGYWIEKNRMATLRGFLSEPHIVVGLGFRGNGRVAAAYEGRCYPWMGDVYHLLRKTSLLTTSYDLTDMEVVEYLNSDVITRYVKDVYREVTYHLSITQLSILPLPTKGEWEETKRGL